MWRQIYAIQYNVRYQRSMGTLGRRMSSAVPYALSCYFKMASQLAKQLKSIAQSWPQDPFRPNMQLQNFFLSLSSHPKLTPNAIRAVQALRNNELSKKVS